MTREKRSDGSGAATPSPGGGIEATIRACLDEVREQAASPAELALADILAQEIAGEGRDRVVGSTARENENQPLSPAGRDDSGDDGRAG